MRRTLLYLIASAAMALMLASSSLHAQFDQNGSIPNGPSNSGISEQGDAYPIGSGGSGPTNDLLLSTGGSNFLLLSDGVSKLCLSSGC